MRSIRQACHHWREKALRSTRQENRWKERGGLSWKMSSEWWLVGNVVDRGIRLLTGRKHRNKQKEPEGACGNSC
jgi:hypothetical protein